MLMEQNEIRHEWVNNNYLRTSYLLVIIVIQTFWLWVTKQIDRSTNNFFAIGECTVFFNLSRMCTGRTISSGILFRNIGSLPVRAGVRDVEMCLIRSVKSFLRPCSDPSTLLPVRPETVPSSPSSAEPQRHPFVLKKKKKRHCVEHKVVIHTDRRRRRRYHHRLV